MTAKQVLDAALSLLFETGATAGDYTAFSLPLLNLLLPELLSLENGRRDAEGAKRLEEAPELLSLDDEIPYSRTLLRSVLPYGLAAKLVYDDNDMGKVSYFQQLYVNAANTFAQAVPETVVDVY